MKKNILISGIIGILVGALVGYFMYNKPHRNIATEKTDFTVSANELFDAFDENEKEANAKYLDKVIEVSGVVIDVENNQEGNSVVTLEAENAMIGGVLCTLKSGESLLSESKATLKCKCTGFLTDVVLTNCTVLK